MRAPHFLLAALVALATSFSLHAFAAHRHHGFAGWRRGPFSHYGGRWGHRFGRDCGPGEFAPPFAQDSRPRPGATPPLPAEVPAPLASPALADSTSQAR